MEAQQCRMKYKVESVVPLKSIESDSSISITITTSTGTSSTILPNHPINHPNMRFSTIASIAVLGLTVSAAEAPAEKRQLNKFDKCTNYGAEWCVGDEILTCKQYAGTDKGRVKSTHKACVEKREEKRDVGDPCPKIGMAHSRSSKHDPSD